MSNKSNYNGRAFEYSCIKELKRRIGKYRSVVIDEGSIEIARKAWNFLNNTQQNDFIKAADAFIDTLFDMEPSILECKSKDDIVQLYLNKDLVAEQGDIRDIIIKREKIGWEIGVSVKHNHFAIKHSRLSSRIDFGYKWYGISCSKKYWQEVNPIFSKLKSLREQNVKWCDINNKNVMVYIPLLTAFKKEIKRAYKKDCFLPQKLISYLLGIRDFYKIIAKDSERVTELQCFNLRSELNKNTKYKKARIIVPKVQLPNKIVSIGLKTKSDNILEMYLNNGWTLSFRIHNARKIVEPSLKFDIQFVSLPKSIVSIKCSWS